LRFTETLLKDTYAARYLIDREQAGFVAVIEVGGVVANLIGEVNQLRFEWRTQFKKILAEFGMIFRGVVVRVFDDAFTHFKRQIQSAESGIAEFEVFHDAERVQVVIEGKSVLAHGRVEGFFSCMSKGRMADVMHQR